MTDNVVPFPKERKYTEQQLRNDRYLMVLVAAFLFALAIF